VLAPGSYRFGPDDGRLLVEINRDGLARRVGHDLVLLVESWSAEATVKEDLPASSLVVTADLRSLSVAEGRGGLIPLMERDKRDILSSARKVLGSDAQPELVWTSSGVTGDGATITAAGELRRGDRAAPVDVVLQVEAGSVTARAEIRQSALGIKPYQAFLGALRVKDLVTVTATVNLPS
jgi:hypothetical protein